MLPIQATGESSVNLASDVELLDALSKVLDMSEPGPAFAQLLSGLLAFTDSEGGFIGSVLYHHHKPPHLKIRAISKAIQYSPSRSIGKDDVTRKKHGDYPQRLFESIMATGQPLINNGPVHGALHTAVANDDLSLTSLLGIPIYQGSTVIGIVGLANRSGGYDAESAERLTPFLTVLSNVLATYGA